MAHDMYKGYTVYYTKNLEGYSVHKNGRMVYKSPSYDGALVWIDKMTWASQTVDVDGLQAIGLDVIVFD
jgi:hypothetical protein